MAAHDRLRRVLESHEYFLAFCSEKEVVLSFVVHFPPQHALRLAVTRALVGEPFSIFWLAADDACCHIAEALGDADFRKESAGKHCVDCFYGASLRALVAGATPTQPSSHVRHSQLLSLDQWCRITDIPCVAEGFMRSVRRLHVPPRLARKMDACETRFEEAWQRVIKALNGVQVDTRQLLLVHIALRRILPADIAKLVLRMFARWPVAIDCDDSPNRKRRRRA